MSTRNTRVNLRNITDVKRLGDYIKELNRLLEQYKIFIFNIPDKSGNAVNAANAANAANIISKVLHANAEVSHRNVENYSKSGRSNLKAIAMASLNNTTRKIGNLYNMRKNDEVSKIILFRQMYTMMIDKMKAMVSILKEIQKLVLSIDPVVLFRGQSDPSKAQDAVFAAIYDFKQLLEGQLREFKAALDETDLPKAPTDLVPILEMRLRRLKGITPTSLGELQARLNALRKPMAGGSRKTRRVLKKRV